MTTSDRWIEINGRRIGPGNATYLVAEMSANHNQDFDTATGILEAAKEAGADAVKIQTYTPDTITIDCSNEHFLIKGTPWDGRTLYELYGEAYTPWEWQPKLKRKADDLELDLFSTPFDPTAVDFLEQMDLPAYKVASFEIVDLPLLRRIGETGKPVIMSTGMATLAEIDEAVSVLRESGSGPIALLKCTSAYPAPPEEMHLRTIPHLSDAFDVPAGLSDHTQGIATAVAAVALGACIIEKHVTLDRSVPSPDAAFSLEPDEFRQMIQSVRVAEKALGQVNYKFTEEEGAGRAYRKSLFVVSPVKAGELFTAENVRCIRPAHGLHPRYLDRALGRRAACNIAAGTPLQWAHVS